MTQAEKHFYEFGRSDWIPPTAYCCVMASTSADSKGFRDINYPGRNSGRVMDKDDLLPRRSGRIPLSKRWNLAKNVSYLRKILGSEEAAQYIETIPRRGYRFVANVKDVCDEARRISPGAGYGDDRN